MFFSFMQGVVLGLLLFPMLFKYALHLCECYLNRGYSEARRSNEIWTSLLFFSSLGFILVVIIPSWMQIVQDFHMHPLLWYCRPVILLHLLYALCVLNQFT